MAVARIGNFGAFPGSHLGAYRLFCLWGENDALIRERVGALRTALSRDNPPDVLDLDGDDLAKSPFDLADEIGSVSLFAEVRLLRVRLGTRSTVEVFEHALPALEKAQDVTVVVEGDGDKRQEETIGLLSDNPRALVVRCAPDSAEDLADHARKVLAAAGIAMEGDIADDLVERTDGDRAFLANELAKLLLLVPDGGVVDHATLQATVADEESAVFDDIVRAIFAGQVESVLPSLDRLTGATDASQLAGVALRTALWSHKSLVDGGHARTGRASAAEVRRMIARLSAAVEASRSSDRLAETAAERLAIRLAQHQRR